MKHSRSRISLCLLFVVVGLGGCSWDASLYETYARNNEVVQCPPGNLMINEDNPSLSYVDLRTLRCYSGAMTFKTSQNDTSQKDDHERYPLSKNEEDGHWEGWDCVDRNQNCLAPEDGHCKACAEIIDDYRMCLALQDFSEIYAEGNEKMPSIAFIGDYGTTTNHIFDYPDAGKNRICPSDYGKCYYHKEDKLSTAPGEFGCVSSCPSTMVECGGQCIDPKTNEAFCGASGDCSGEGAGKACADGLSCVDGECKLLCTAGQVICVEHSSSNVTGKEDEGVEKCVDVKKDDDHCGVCNHPCDPGLNCIEGKCELECLEGQIKCPGGDNVPEKDKRCINPLSDNKYCGATAGCTGATECVGGQTCLGACRCPDGMLFCNQNCTDVRYSDQHCGECGKSCGNNEKCIDSVCVKIGCDDTQETLCTNQNQCVNLNNSIDNCGVCGSSCKDHPMPHAVSNACENGKCKYECIIDDNIEYTMCDGECVNTMNNAKYCKNANNNKHNDPKCGGVCEANEYCDNGECKPSSCSNECLFNGSCVNRNIACGTQCIDCTSLPNVSSTQCNEGVCDAKVCSNGFHLSKTGSIHECVANTSRACGAVDSIDVVDCEVNFYGNNHVLNEGYESASCVLGKCEIKCKNGYYATEDNKCIEYDPEHCNGVNCNTKYSNSKETTCNNGVCVLVECEDGYHIKNTNDDAACEVNSNTVCGSTTSDIVYDCTNIANSNKKCLNNGECECKSKYKFKVDKYEPEMAYCAQEQTCAGVVCEDMDGWLTGDCEDHVQGYNVCDAYTCQKNYVLTHKSLSKSYYQGVCRKNTDESCSIYKYHDQHNIIYPVSCTSMSAVCNKDYGLCYRDNDNKYYCESKTSYSMDWRNLSDCDY